MQSHQGNVAATGHMEVLKAMGYFSETLPSYDAVIESHPSNAVAATSRAEVLEAMGRFDDALAAYRAIYERFPWDEVTRNGYAWLLGQRGDLKAAFARLPEHPRSEEDWIALLLCGLIGLEASRFAEARRSFAKAETSPGVHVPQLSQDTPPSDGW